VARTYVQVIKDDLTGEIIEDGAAETVEFSVNGKSYTIDLSRQSAADFHQGLEKYIAVATKVGAPVKARRPGSVRAEKEQLAAIRSWAQQNGYKIAARGRISAEILDAYHKA
jgi:hypothetical protein